MSIKPFKLALIQMHVEGGEKTRNLNHAVELIAEAASNGAQVALLPECLDLGWTHPSSLTEAEPISVGFPCTTLINAAIKNKIYVCAGLTEKAEGKVYNSAAIIDTNGIIKCLHRKINELEIGYDFYSQGDRLNIAETEFGTFGLMICADARAQDFVLSKALGQMGADIILSPCAWAVPDDHDNSKTPYGKEWQDAYSNVAKEFSVWIAGVSNVGLINGGPWKNRKCIGCSLVVGSDGKEIAQGPYGVDAETILYVDVCPSFLTNHQK